MTRTIYVSTDQVNGLLNLYQSIFSGLEPLESEI